MRLMRLPPYWFNLTGKTQRRTVTVTNGSAVITYADNLTNQRARLVVGGGGENSVGGERLVSQSPYKLYFPGAPDVLTTDRFAYNNRVFDIMNVNNFDEAGAYTRCDAVEVLPSGVGA